MGSHPYLSVPQHIALLMDGNGRWARKRGLSRTAGHHAGTAHIIELVQTCIDTGVSYLTLYAFSTENWQRPPLEVAGMLHVMSAFLDREVQSLHAMGVRLRHLGRTDRVSKSLERKVHHALALTRHNRRLTLSVAFDYGGRADIVAAVQEIMRQGIPPSAITEETIKAHLATHDLPDPDLLIRTSGEQRLSNFLLWDTARSVFWTTPVCWPDFRGAHLLQAIAETSYIDQPVQYRAAG
ncbi:MAG: di-trans,poly-cis-decaprenylcistransferase [Chloroflexaceae bacterium]|nr:di-trans,poly-cis-decaprenylcistransferase [Chloroflexaceae bacterium]